MPVESDLLIGSKAICEFCGGVSPKTVRRWSRTRGFPVHIQGGTWIASKTKIREWTTRHIEHIKPECKESDDLPV